MNKNLFLIVFFVAFNITIGFAEIPGKYEIIAPLQPPDAHSLEQVRVDEVLAFDCDHCYEFYSTTYPKLKKTFGNKIKIVLRPIGWRGHDPGRLYFIAQRKGKGEQVMATIFDFIHEKEPNVCTK
jgi:hypothetical protein